MAQSMSVKLSRTDASPWGFRLQGGKDFGAPLLIQKVNGGSPAERAGLQAGDAVIKVNNTEVFNLRHKDAQDNIVRAGNSFEITVQRGGSTWKPTVIPVGPQPIKPQVMGNVTPVTKTSLAANKQPASPIGTGHNYTPAPFGQPQMNGSNGVDPVKSIVNKQYNSPVGIYSEETIAETLSAQAEVLAGGVLGVNFKKNEKNYDPANSEVFKMLNEIANDPEPEMGSSLQYFSHSSHAIGGRATSPRPVTPIGQRMGPPPQTAMKSFPLPGSKPLQKTAVKPFSHPAAKPLPQSTFKQLPQTKQLPQIKPLPKTASTIPKVTSETPQCSDCERNIVGAPKPAGAISAALANRGPAQPPSMFNRAPAPAPPPSMFNRGPVAPAPAQPASAFNRAPPGPAPGSPQPSNFGPVPFHAPGGFSAVKPSFNASAPAPMPSSPVAPPFASSPSMTPAKPAAVSGKFVWPPKTPTEEICSLPTATPLYIPPSPSKVAANIYEYDQSAVAVPESQQESLIQSVPQTNIQPFPEPYAEFVTHHPIARPMSAYHYTPKPLGTNEERPKSAFAAPVKSTCEQFDTSFESLQHKVEFEGDVQFIENDDITSMPNFEQANMDAQRKKYSMCSQEVMNFNEHNVISSSVEHLSDSIDTAILVSSLTGRPESPVPMDHINQYESTYEDVSATQNTILKKHSVNATTQQVQESSVNTVHTDEKELVDGLKNVIETQGGTVEQVRKQSMGREQTNLMPVYEPPQCQSPFVDALTTAPDRPYSPFPNASDVPPPPSLSPRPTTLPVSYRQLPEPKEVFVPITKAETTMLPILVNEREKSSLVSALTIAPTVAVCPLPPPMEPLSTKPVPFPQQTAPYHTLERSEACPSPMISALTIAPDRSYSPFAVTQAPASVIDTAVPVMKTSIDVGEPFNLPTPSHYSSMLSALTIAPDRPYSPLTVTQAPTSTTDSGPMATKPESSVNMMPQRIVGDVQAAVFKPTAEAATAQPVVPQKQAVIAPEPKQAVAAEPPKQKQVVKSDQVKTAQVTQTKKTQNLVQKTQGTVKKVAIKENVKKSGSQQIKQTQKTSQSTNALNLQRQTQQRPITPKIARPTTPSSIKGLSKPSTIPYYQQNISDGDFPCRSPRPTTPNISCPMTATRPQTPGMKGEIRSITPIQHKQLQKVRSLTPVSRTSETSGTPGQSHQSVTQRVLNTVASEQGGQVVVTKKTRVTEEFESFHKESTQVIEKSGTSQKCILQTENKSALAEQSVLDNKEVTTILNGSTTQSKTSSFEGSQFAEQCQQVSVDSQYNIQPIEIQQQMPSLPVQSIQKEGFMSLEESQRDSPLPFPNISLPEGMKYEVVDNKALYSTVSQKEMFKINYLNQAAQPSQPVSQFHVQAPTNKQPFVQLMAPKFEAKQTMIPYIPSAPTPPQMTPTFVPPQQPLGQVKFQPLAPQPILSTANQIQAPTATLPVIMSSSQQFNGNNPQCMSSIPIMSTGINNFTPKSSGNGFQNFAPKSAAVEPASITARKSSLDVVSRRLSSDVAFKNVVPSPFSIPASNVPQGTPPRRESQGILKHTQDVVPKTVAPGIRVPGLMDPCTSPPNAGGGAGGKGAFAGSSAPVRGRGVLNQPGARQAVCGQCHGQIRGPFVTALGKIWCPEHFVCSNPQCKRQLADIGFVEEKGQLYCEYCFEQFIAPPCNKCSNKIKGDCLNAIGKTFHPECFCCCYCGKLFGNNPFFLEDGMPYCQADWNELFTTKCFACGFPIEAGDRWVEALNNNYHSQCFNCTSCKKNLEGQSFFAKSGRPFCKAHAR